MTPIEAGELRAEALGLGTDDGRALVPEHVVKRVLRGLGAVVPDGACVTAIADLATAAAKLRTPLVLKAWGDGIVHKSDVGGVRLGLDATSIGAAATEIVAAVAAHGLEVKGFLVEEQAERGDELIIGVVQRSTFGPVLVLGLGGVLTEILDDVVARLCPITAGDAAEMLGTFRGAPLLDGVRGKPPVDRAQLVRLLIAVAGRGGLVDQLGASLGEFECNPVILTAHGPVVADARLILAAGPSADRGSELPPSPVPFSKLFTPKTIAVAGVSTKGAGFGNRAVAAYRDFGWNDGLYVVHPTADEVDGVPAVRSIADIEGGVDYLLVAVPARACVELVETSGRHAGVVHVISGGFAEADANGAELEARLLHAARSTGVRVVGPNCMGVYAPAGRQTFVLGAPHDAGPVGFVSQSGGIAGDVVRVGAKRGLRFSKVVSMGNAVDVSPGELVEHLVFDDATRVVGCYLEGARDGANFVDALRAARGRKPVVVLVAGLSAQGADAVASHTGSLAGDRRLWDAIAAATGATVVATLEDLLGTLVFHQRYANAREANDANDVDDAQTMVLGVGGGASVLAVDACDRAGLQLAPIAPALVARLREMGHGAGTSVVNPVEISAGPAAPVDVFNRVLDVVLPEQPFSDVLVHLNVASYYSYGNAGLAPLIGLLATLGRGGYAARLVLVARNLDAADGNDVDRLYAAANDAGVPCYRTFDEAASAVAAGQRFANQSNA
ncbi:MAG: hypothetical protein JWL83_3932 [Actinomycetia bacterium]|nr:hypothetical protein [Actinomycetes bacterium]